MGWAGPVRGQRKAQSSSQVPLQQMSYSSSPSDSSIIQKNDIHRCIFIQMSRGNEKHSSTFYGDARKKMAKTPNATQTQLRRTQPRSIDARKKAVDSQSFHDVALHEKDERFRYLLKHGQLRKVEKGGNIIFAELPQIPNVWVCYRRPVEREASLEKLNLDSLELGHVPLLEGEQKLKMLTFQHNKLTKIQNLISLPNILYLDLQGNLIKDIQNIHTLVTLKVLLLSKNQISRIRSINQLVKLQVLDLHSNRLQKMEGFGLLNSLRILNLSHNQILRMENMQTLSNLNELNLKSNLITTIENIQKLSKLEKLYLTNNRIEIKVFEQCQLGKMQSLKELTLQNNPCCKERAVFLRHIMKHLPGLKQLDGKTPSLMQEALQDSEEEENHEEVLKLIATQWKEEIVRVQQIESGNGTKKQYLRTTCITGGHAEIQDENILFIYGNSYDVVLTNQSFQETVEKIRFQYIFIEFLIEQNILNTLKKFKKLKILEFKECYIMSLLQIAKLENLPNLKIITIEAAGNPIYHCTFLKEFVIYRFPSIIQINREDIKEADRNRAKNLFQHFDKVLQIPEKCFGPQNIRNYPSEEAGAKKDKNYLKSFNKIVNEGAEQVVQKCAAHCQSRADRKGDIEEQFDLLLLEMIGQARKKE